MKVEALRDLVESMVAAVTMGDGDARSRIAERLVGLGGRDWLRLDELARQGLWRDGAPVSGLARHWPEGRVDLDLVGVIAYSMHFDGRVREPAVRALASYRETLATAALGVRVGDWVNTVARTSSMAIAGRTGVDDAAVLVPLMLALSERYRPHLTAKAFLEDLAQSTVDVLTTLAMTGERVGRLWALDVLATRETIDDPTWLARAETDPDPVVALVCAHRLLTSESILEDPVASRLLDSPRAVIRAFALEHCPNAPLDPARVRGLLLDRSGAVRSLARWQWARRWDSPADIYRTALGDTHNPRRLAAALQGLDEIGAGDTATRAILLLGHPSPTVRHVAVKVVGRRTAPADLVALLPRLLCDQSNKVNRAVVKSLRGHVGALPPSILADLDTTDTQRARRTALTLRQHLGTWHRVHADLQTLSNNDQELVRTARSDLLAWLAHGAATTYTPPTHHQAHEITALLATPHLTADQRREIAFVARI